MYRYAEPVKVTEGVYSGIIRAWETDKKSKLRYSIAGMVARLHELGEKEASEWVAAHEEAYGEGVWYGFYTEGMTVPAVTSVGARSVDRGDKAASAESASMAASGSERGAGAPLTTKVQKPKPSFQDPLERSPAPLEHSGPQEGSISTGSFAATVRTDTNEAQLQANENDFQPQDPIELPDDLDF